MSHSAADLLTPEGVNALLLLACRLGGLLLIAPIYSSRTVPAMVRTALLVVLVWLLAPVAIDSSGGMPTLTLTNAFSETLVGFAIGLGAAVLIAGIEATGELLSIHIGLSGAAVLDPMTNQSVPVLGQFANLFAITLLLSLDAHVGMLDALAASLRFLPVGSPVDEQSGLLAMVSLGTQLFLLGLRFAAPVVVVVLLGNVALAVLSRAAPQLNILAVAFPIQISLGLFALAASIPLLVTFFTGWHSVYDQVLSTLLFALRGGRGG